ncbi:sugar phosphate nucleotidyltransferase [Butyrivibrio sp. INlla21]|uniref:sugar phosphate nucleotidyltransferase n=1 Tax=Butyrivibrio sp. INlla21 TaxID=1520811 RepID=UPI0008E26194|nr:sugar phosphate nucleotidyltransferase [Butyrivibrio sp. INlla21]SFV02722.1 CBS domain-containing protein [Butyrivibrio sp. INlla21]
MDSIQMFLANCNLSVSQAMRKIDSNSHGILFLVDDNNLLVGCVTDGDIRRYLLSGGGMSDVVARASNQKPKVARSLAEAIKLYHNRDYVVIPIINNQGIVIDMYMGEGVKDKKYSPLHLPVVINAGGKGTRLDPFTRVLPKPLIPVGDLPIIELIMQEYQSYSCDEFHIIVNYKRELMKAYFADNEANYNITWYDEEKPLGTGGGLSLLRGKLKSTFFFANCDALLTANYESMLKFHKDNGNVITMICAYKNINIPYGVVEMGENGVITDMKEKPLISFLTNTGIYIVEPEVIDDIGDEEAIGFPDIIEREKQKGKKVAVFPVSENDWMDMGQLPELEKMRKKLFGE